MGTRQRVFAEGLTHGKEQPSAKTLCRGPDPRQRQAHGNNNYLPRAEPLAKGRPSATLPDTMSVFYRQSLPRASPLGPRQRLFNRFCKFFKKILCRAPYDLALGRDSLCRVSRLALGKLKKNCFFLPLFCWALLQ